MKMEKSGLTKRITTTLIVLSVMSVIASTVFMLLMTRQQFSNYIQKNNQAMLNQWAPLISDYYGEYGADGLQDYLESSNTMGMGNGMGWQRRGLMRSMSMKMRQGQRLVVADRNNIVIADTQQSLIGQAAEFGSLHVSSRPLRFDNRKIGTLYMISPLGSGLASLENDFISQLSISTIILALFMGLIALILGLVLGKRVSSPLADLSAAIHKLAQGQLDERIALQGDQEFIELGQDFNLMAQKLEDADQNRRRLTADLSHELRTPLTFLRGQLEGMQTGSIPMDTENTTLLLDEVIRLSRLVKELENLAQVENHAVKLRLTSFPIVDLLEHLTPVNLAMQDKGILFKMEVGTDINVITADHDRLMQILLNLLSNAMQHVGEAGEVSLSIQRHKNYLQFVVADNGSGISPADLPQLFERFYRVDDSRNRREGGMGLGLAIAKGYVEAHQGKIWVESNPGLGTNFYFTLPQ